MKDKNRELLWVVDSQHDFMDADGKLYVEGAEDIKSNLKKVMDDFKDHSIVFTQDWHYYDSEELSTEPDFVNTFPEHCMAGTIGADLIDEVKPDHYDLIVNWDQKLSRIGLNNTIIERFNILLRKDKFDFVSGNSNSKQFLALLLDKFDKVYVVGVAGNVCVNQAVLGLKDYFEVTVIENAISDLPNIPSCVENWKNMGIEVI